MKRLTLAAVLAALAVAVALAFPLEVAASVEYRVESGVVIAVVQITGVGAPNTTYGIEVRGPDNQLVAVREVDSNSTGLFAITLSLPDSYPPGNYAVYVSGGGENATTYFALNWSAAIAPKNATTPAGKGAFNAAANLIEVAARLSQLVDCRNAVLESYNVSQTEMAGAFQSVLNLTATGNHYLKLANASLASGNYTAAFRYAQLAIQYYGRALELQELIADHLDVSFAACKAVLAPPKAPPAGPKNATCKWTPEFYPLMTALNVTERRIGELERLIALTEEKGYNVSGLQGLLDQARELIEEGRSLAVSCNVSAAAHKLAEAKKIVGAVNAALAKLGAERLAKDLRKAGIELNETEVEELRKSVGRGKVLEKISELANRTLARVRERIRNMTEEQLREMEKKLSNIEKLLDKIGRSEKEKEMNRQIGKLIEEIKNVRKSIEEKRAPPKVEPPSKGKKK